MKTRTFTPSFYLANKDMYFSINTKITIGRSAGDIVLEEDEMLSSVHCELQPRLLEVFIKDLNSTNGTFVNEQKIFPTTEVKLKVGDQVKIGSSVYTLFDDIKEAKKLQPGRNRRKNPRPKNYYGFSNFVTFFAASKPYHILYVALLILTILSFALNLKLDVILPDHLQFISKMYSEQILHSGIRTVFMVYFLSLIHGLTMQLYFNRNPLRKIFSLVVFGAGIFMLADFAYGPLGGIKMYAVERKEVEELKPGEKAIVYLRKLTDHKSNLKRGQKEVAKLVREEDKKFLADDYEKLMKKLDSEINKVGKLLK